MKKIIWISSYPKSGNTWLRYLLGNYFYNSKNIFNYNIIQNIDKFPSEKYFKNLDNLAKLKIFKNPKLISNYWIDAQNNINKEVKDFIFFKTHTPLIVLDKNYFTNENLSLAIINIVRDPRDVVISYANFTNKSIDETIDFITTKKLFIRSAKNKQSLDFDMLGSWSLHYTSWRDGLTDIPRILIKYEDLLENTNLQFLNVINFLSKILNIEVSKEKIEFSVKSSKFSTLSKWEQDAGFYENSNRNKKNFFNIGKKNQWKSKLTSTQIQKIEKNFQKEMKQIGYL